MVSVKNVLVYASSEIYFQARFLTSALEIGQGAELAVLTVNLQF